MSDFYGKYRGKGENNVDPLQQGRVQVSVPAVLGDVCGRENAALAHRSAPVGVWTGPPAGSPPSFGSPSALQVSREP